VAGLCLIYDHMDGSDPMTLLHLPADGRAANPWRNGGGVTREVAIDGGRDDFRWRISIADVAADGPFSVFEDCGRVIALLRGAGMVLTVDGVPYAVDRPFVPFRFEGDAATDCRLVAGPVTDFNVIHAHDQPATVEIIQSVRPVALGPTGRAVVVALEEFTWVRTTSASVHLESFDAVDIRDEPDPVIDGGVVAVVRVDHPTV
jgi:uncharacterized protein